MRHTLSTFILSVAYSSDIPDYLPYMATLLVQTFLTFPTFLTLYLPHVWLTYLVDPQPQRASLIYHVSALLFILLTKHRPISPTAK